MPGQLLGPDGNPISSKIWNKKADPPKLGPAFGDWAGRDREYMTLPGGGVVQFNLDNLTLYDYRQMIDHYQINASLSVLSFMQHQSDFVVECSDKRIADFCDEQMHTNWTMLNRSMSTANWAGFSPNALEWDNDYNGRSVVLSKIKDLIPEECAVHWKKEKGWAPPGRIPPEFKTFDGIRQLGMSWPIPVENSFWFPILMENGNYYGRKLLRSAFQSWFFSILLHLFANRYYERFGEPVPIGRAPYDEEIAVSETESIQGNDFLLRILQALRSRSAVVLPSSTHQVGAQNHEVYDYDIEYLESQMRGADFERYMTRLDEEMSLGLFTPVLLFRTADVGSYNLGQGHMQMYLWMLNALNEDRAYYIDRYILSKMVDYNFSENAPRANIKFRKMGNASSEMVKELLMALINAGRAEPDLVELGQMAGMKIKEIEQTVAPKPKPGDTPPAGSAAKNTIKDISTRVRKQIDNAIKDGSLETLRVNMGYLHRFEKALAADGVQEWNTAAQKVYGRMDSWLSDTVALGVEEFPTTDSFMDLFDTVLTHQIEEVSRA